MRFLIQFSFPPDKVNELVADGKAGEKVAEIIDETNPEAAYFYFQDGRRGGLAIVDMKDTSELPKITEPWVLSFEADVTVTPVMTAQDLQRSDLNALGQRWD